jgi:peptide/nickel transport system substrate-binding protein
VNFQSLDLFLVPEEATRVAALRAGEADIVPVGVNAKEQVKAGGGRMVFGQEGVIVDIFMYGCYDPQFPCHDKRVRQALNYAFDKSVLRDELFGGPEVFQIKGWSVITPSTLGYTPELDPWPFDPDKARQLMADAGYPGGKGFGKLIVNTHTSLSMPNQVEAAQIGAAFWRKELGIDVEVRVSENVVRKKLEGSYGLNGQIWWRDNETRIDGAVGGVIANKYIDPEHKTRAHEDPELFARAQGVWAILDADQREEALKKLWLELRDESYHLGVGYLNIPWAVGPNVLTWEPYPLSISPSALHTITLK